MIVGPKFALVIPWGSTLPRYFANVARDGPRISPDELPSAIGVLPDPSKPGDIIGIAYWTGHAGGLRWDWNRPSVEPEYLGKREAVWCFVIGKVEAEGRLALRMGEFVKLAEYAF